jgi:hypothetical protein
MISLAEPGMKNALYSYIGHTQKKGAVSKADTQFISNPTRAQHTLSTAGPVQVSLALSAVRF